MADTDEVTRRLVHASGAILPAAYLAGLLAWPHLQALLILATVVAAGLEAVRLIVGLDWIVFDKLTRHYEQNNLAGYALYVFGATVAALAFEPEFAVPAILMLMIGDPVSGLTGSDELRDIKDRSVLVIMFGTCLALALIARELAFPNLSLAAAVAAAAAATIADGVKPVVATYVIDDNLTIPIAAALAGFLVARYLPEELLLVALP